MVFVVAVFVFALVFHYGNAVLECPVPGVTPLVFFDLEQLSLMALQQGSSGLFQSPMLCPTGKDEECSKQQCCHEEVGCCNIDPKKHIRKCGCKKKGDKVCNFLAPYTILAITECNNDMRRKIAGCLRQNLGNENHSISITNTNTTLQPVKNGKHNSRKPLLSPLSSILLKYDRAVCDAECLKHLHAIEDPDE